MKTTSVWFFCVGAAIVFTGCGEADPPGASGDAGSGGGSSSSSGSGGGGGAIAVEWAPLIKADWKLDPGSENTSDEHTFTLDRDMYIGAIRPIAPPGTHHTVLEIEGLGAGANIIYASGVGTNALVFPEGVGLKLAAGETLVLQLHLFNTSFETLTGTSGIEVIEVQPSDVKEEADLFLPGPFELSIPPNQMHTTSSTCKAKVKQNVFAIFPHMHQLGSHFKSTLNVGGVEKVLHDDAYDFNHQAFIPFEPIAMEPGDSVKTECTWNNTTTQTVTWGESSTTEMCFSILYRYPAQDGSEFCVE